MIWDDPLNFRSEEPGTGEQENLEDRQCGCGVDDRNPSSGSWPKSNQKSVTSQTREAITPDRRITGNASGEDAKLLVEVLDNPFEGILAIDDRGIVTFVNTFFLNILNTAEEHILGKKVWHALPGMPPL